ncbi:MAG TPA: galactokinase [Burkholderiaceae bacterium]|nr:galactokinase [Burkholderiaceae bacterium]
MTLPATRETALAALERAFGPGPSRLVRAPGRVNLIGEHTDYNEGFVLPCAIGRGTVIAGRPRADAQVRVIAADLEDATDAFAIDGPIAPRHDASWTHYVRGCAEALRARGLIATGADLAIAGDLPTGAGLSSSASLSIAVLQAFKTLYDLETLDRTTMARMAQQAEHRYARIACGMMDPLASAHGRVGHALLIDCRIDAVRPVPMPPGVTVLIVHSGVRRGLATSEYNVRRAQCEAGAAHFGVPFLRDVTEQAFEAGAAALDPLLRRRARHIVTENARTLAAARALELGDLRALGDLMRASHVSMRDDFEITEPSVDRLSDVLNEAIGDAGGARMTGGGFGGCVVAVLPDAALTTAFDAVDKRYRTPDGTPAMMLVSPPADGAGVLE